jgi:hypothetical protein
MPVSVSDFCSQVTAAKPSSGATFYTQVNQDRERSRVPFRIEIGSGRAVVSERSLFTVHRHGVDR